MKTLKEIIEQLKTDGFGYLQSVKDLESLHSSLPDERAIFNEAEELNAPKDEEGRTIYKYAFDDDQQDAFIEGAMWMKSKIDGMVKYKI